MRPGQPQPSAGGYGYQVWVLAGERRMFVLRGVRGQAIYVDPASRMSWFTLRSENRPAIRASGKRTRSGGALRNSSAIDCPV